MENTGYMPGQSSSGLTHCLEHNLQDLIINPRLRRQVLLELRHCLLVLDKKLVDKCQEYITNSPDPSSMLYQTARGYLTANVTRRPLFIAMHTIDMVLANPNFLREFFLILVTFLQFKDVVKQKIAPRTLEPVFQRYFGNVNFYSRFQTFLPGADPLQTVDAFIHNEWSLFLLATSLTNGATVPSD